MGIEALYGSILVLGRWSFGHSSWLNLCFEPKKNILGLNLSKFSFRLKSLCWDVTFTVLNWVQTYNVFFGLSDCGFILDSYDSSMVVGSKPRLSSCRLNPVCILPLMIIGSISGRSMTYWNKYCWMYRPISKNDSIFCTMLKKKRKWSW